MVSQENVLEPGSPLYSRFSYEYREIDESLEVLRERLTYAIEAGCGFELS